MIMESPSRKVSDLVHADHRRRLALLDAFTTSIKTLRREPASRGRFQLNDPTDSATAHAAANIARWRSYLPEDCVTAMISAGWQWST